MPVTLPMVPFNGPVWRLLPPLLVDAPTTPAQAQEGRFHHSGQVAAYASLTPEGAQVAIRRYLGDGVARVLVSLRLTAQWVADARGNPAASVVWQDLREAGQAAPTWVISDEARRAGADAMLYSSRSRPDLSHIVVFRIDCFGAFGRPT